MQNTDASVERRSPDLRARRRRQTELEIHTAAVTLAAERGTDQVTVDDIAARAGVSARTFFRYFATRDRALVHDRWGFDDAIDELFTRKAPHEVRLRDIEEAFGSVLANMDDSADVEATASMYKILMSSPQLMGAATARANERTDGLLETIPAAERSRVRFMLAVAGTVLFAAFTEWNETGVPTGASGTRSLLAAYRRLCGELPAL
ncbi:TetR family transcriptional regulator [Nocardia sp. NPDC049149]|uniref:TetR/AcrR family transcriptional regulator n=1 Tax=Nocardia sp. NPDC049149 TaxID=3364315 RepID=UPI003723C69C